MRETGDAFDLVTVILAMILLLTVCMWSLSYTRASTAATVTEKSVIYNQYGQSITAPTKTAKDALMYLVVNDHYLPNPKVVVFKHGSASYTVTFDSNYFENKDTKINEAWNNFFKNRMGLTITSVALNANATQWIVTLQ